MEDIVLGYDCDGNELYEYDIVRAIWYSYIDFNTKDNIDPRMYTIICSSNGTPYLISVFDNWNKKAINKFEKRDLNATVPIKIKSINESISYEKAYDCNNKTFKYKFDDGNLKKILNKKLNK